MTERKLMKKAATCCQITPGSDLKRASFFAPRNILRATNIAMQPKSPVSQVPPLKAERSAPQMTPASSETNQPFMRLQSMLFFLCCAITEEMLVGTMQAREVPTARRMEADSVRW